MLETKYRDIADVNFTRPSKPWVLEMVGSQVPRYSGCKLLVTNFFSATQRAALETKYRDIADVNGLYRVTNRDTGVKLETKYRDIADVNRHKDVVFNITPLETKYRDIADVNLSASLSPLPPPNRLETKYRDIADVNHAPLA